MLTPAYIDGFPELAIHILSYLSLPDILACLRTHIALYKLIKDSVVLQYHINTQLAGVEDDPSSTIAVHERLDRLNSRETGWAQHDFDFSWVIKVPPDCSWIHDLTSGVILLNHGSRQAIIYSTLPSSPSDKMMWRTINVGANIASMGLAKYEHDLIAVATTTSQDNVKNIEIALLELSTGAPHPQARRPRLFIKKSQRTHPCIHIGIAGDTLALIITYHNNPPIPKDNFYIFDWKTGVLKMHTTAPGNSYTSLLFLSPTLLILPNAITGTLEFWDPMFTHPIGALGLPHPSDGWVFKPITCRCDPEPRASGTPHSPHSFHTSPADALALFNIRLESSHGIEAFSMFVHRNALLRLRPSPPSDATSMGTFVVVPWDAWGPYMARWIIGEPSHWGMNTAGERAVMAGPRPGTHVVVDFRPWRLREGRTRREKKSLHLHTLVVDTPGEMVHPAFATKVNSGPPYVRRMLTRFQPYDGLLMDEERLIGLKMDESGSRLKEFVIHHLGARPQVDGTMQKLRKLIGRGLNWLG